jgi:hypothetical protein
VSEVSKHGIYLDRSITGLQGVVIPLHSQTPNHISGGWSHYTDTSKSVRGDGALYYVHCPIRVSNQGPFDH